MRKSRTAKEDREYALEGAVALTVAKQPDMRMLGRLLATDCYPQFCAFLRSELKRLNSAAENEAPDLNAAVVLFGSLLLAMTLASTGATTEVWSRGDFEERTGRLYARTARDYHERSLA